MFNDLVVSHLNSAILVSDSNLAICFANPKAESLLAISARKLISMQFGHLFKHISFDLTRLPRCLSDHQSFTDAEVQMMTFDGARHQAEVTVTPFIDQNQQFLLYEIRQIDQLNKINQDSWYQSQLLASRDLIRGLAHEIKNPLGGIRGAAQILDMMVEDAELKECSQVIIEQSDRLRTLVDRLLGPNKLPQHKIQNIHQTLESVRLLLEKESGHQVEFIRDYDPSIPDFEYDDDQLQQVFLNIARNALQALERRTDAQITFITRIASKQTINKRKHKLVTVVKIVDNGPGIPESIRDTLFYPMVTAKNNGTGLGLSIAQTLTNYHGGKIECNSFAGFTEFTIYLPINQPNH